MENPTQALVLVLALALVACKPGAARSETPREPSVPAWVQGTPAPNTAARSSKAGQAKHPIGRGLYRDSLGTLYLKTQNRKVQHPSQDGRDRPDSIYHSKVSLREKGIDGRLSDVVDTATFARVDSAGIYFGDSGLLYVYSTWPYADPFFALSKKGAKFLGGKKEYLLQQGTLYWEGQKVEGLDNRKLEILRIGPMAGGDVLELITDGKKACIGAYSLDAERLKLLDGLTDADRRKLGRYIVP